MHGKKGFPRTARAEGSQLSLLNAHLLMNKYCACHLKRLFFQGNALFPKRGPANRDRNTVKPLLLGQGVPGLCGICVLPHANLKGRDFGVCMAGIPLQCALKRSAFLVQFQSFDDTSIISNT